MVNIGITGADGFVAEALRKELCNLGFNPEGIDISGYKKNGFNNFVKGKDIIFHLAGVNRAEGDEPYIQGNYLLTKELLQSIEKNGKKNCRIIFSSTVQVYGNTPGKISEESAVNPLWAYSKTKRDAEKAIIESGIDYAIMRISNIYGPGVRPFYNSVVATFIHLIKNRMPISVNGSGRQKRDYIFIEDVTSALIKAMEIDKGIYVVSTGKLTSLNALIKAIESGAKKKAIIERKESVEKDIKQEFLNSKLLSTGWKPKFNLTGGIKKCI